MRHGCWPLVHSYEYQWSSRSFPRDNTAGVSSRIFTAKKISNSLTWPVASSCVCTSPLAVMTVVGHLKVVTVKSFLRIMCIDAPESTINSLSSCLILDGQERHHFSVGESNVDLCSSFNFRIFFASFHAAPRAQCSCHSVSSWDRSSNIGAFGLADEDHQGKFYWAMDFGLWRWRCAVRVWWIEHIGLVSAWLSSSVKSMKISAVPCLEKHNPSAVSTSIWPLHFCCHSF